MPTSAWQPDPTPRRAAHPPRPTDHAAPPLRLGLGRGDPLRVSTAPGAPRARLIRAGPNRDDEPGRSDHRPVNQAKSAAISKQRRRCRPNSNWRRLLTTDRDQSAGTPTRCDRYSRIKASWRRRRRSHHPFGGYLPAEVAKGLCRGWRPAGVAIPRHRSEENGGDRHVLQGSWDQIIPSGCPCMFGGPADPGHRCMRAMLRISGKLPRAL
jgi:hypothetical protein